MHLLPWILLALVQAQCISSPEGPFPEWKVTPLTMLGVWTNATDVIVGDVRNVALTGVQKKKLPWPAPSSLNRIYWCEGDFVAQSIVKGKLPSSPLKFLWGSPRPGCKLDFYEQPQDGRPMTRVWFLREEGNHLRPVVDARGLMFVAFRIKWDASSKMDPQTRFAMLLLAPTADTSGRAYFVQSLPESASVACYILGREHCIPELRKLADLGDAALKGAVCDFLRSQFQESCSP